MATAIAEAKLHPTIDVDVECYALEQSIEQLEKENKRLAELNSKLDAIVFSSATNSTPLPSTPSESEM
ncbi:hypothetical protein KBY58_03335 [Cyanobium sp. HWJ4-Hawea]|uniref:hypothetical protein n=1 Tax=Cyanobium sp. HWJ4-Hawea TaxID=2823713 RepID=UPI0020CC8C9F|nr:hypothetical protein [Cyanobium sp. HWJ4-Hawea]MCP9808466.1 hypothetical protein [Cyanobium sp. HWJ4-Hawea]